MKVPAAFLIAQLALISNTAIAVVEDPEPPFVPADLFQAEEAVVEDPEPPFVPADFFDDGRPPFVPAEEVRYFQFVNAVNINLERNGRVIKDTYNTGETFWGSVWGTTTALAQQFRWSPIGDNADAIIAKVEIDGKVIDIFQASCKLFILALGQHNWQHPLFRRDQRPLLMHFRERFWQRFWEHDWQLPLFDRALDQPLQLMH